VAADHEWGSPVATQLTECLCQKQEFQGPGPDFSARRLERAVVAVVLEEADFGGQEGRPPAARAIHRMGAGDRRGREGWISGADNRTETR